MLTSELLERSDHELIKGSLDAVVNGLSFDNRALSEGDVFICVKGAYFDTHDVIKEIDSKKPSLIVVSSDWAEKNRDKADELDSDIVAFKDTRVAKAEISAAYYGYPSEELTVIGVTGSKGKTTTTHMIYESFIKAGRKAGYVATTGGHYGGEDIHFGTTTPDSNDIQKFLREIRDKGCDTVVIEASSQGLKLHRLDMVDFDYGVFLNIEKGDHISPVEHKDFNEYLTCKRSLLRMSRTSVVCADDPHFEEILDGVGGEIVTFGKKEGADYRVLDIEEGASDGDPYVEFSLDGRIEAKITVGMPGSFNVMNAAAAAAVANECGIDMSSVNEALKDIKVPGRLDVIHKSKELTVVIDYAHNGLSTRNLLKALKAYAPKRIVLVFGCGGDRDVDRRPEMGEAAGEMADLSIITTEHNRFEEFEDILKGIKSGIDKTPGKYLVIEDRKEAIRKAILDSEEGDLVAIVGIGNDGFQHDHGKDIPHDDISFSKDVVKEFLEKKKGVQPDYFGSPEQFDVTDGLEHYRNTEGAVLLDVRMKAEYNEGHIPGSICIPLQKIKERAEKMIPDKETPLFCYCVTGARSGRASSILRSLGYEHVYNIGGILGYDGELE